MKTILACFFCILSVFASGQKKNDSPLLQQQAGAYLSKMYVAKSYDSASAMWDSRMFLEMEDFYAKRNGESLTGAALREKVKADVKRYHDQLSAFSIEKFLGTTIETSGSYKTGYVFYQFTQTLKSGRTGSKAMLVFISEDEGKTWVLQDWMIKWIADQVDRKQF